MLELPQSLLEKLQTTKLQETPRIIVVDVTHQKLGFFENHQLKLEYPISTSSKGVGQKVDSYQTPLGLHRIKIKIGKDLPQGAIFENRVFNGQIWISLSIHAFPATSDLITSRILWLEGMEKGWNAGHDAEGTLVDSYERYIYIHGTNHEGEIGRPVSIGCVRMKNTEMITLFDQVQEGDLVWIQE